ncbi:MAG: YtxH domain-containing protein [Anaerolineales bacterium]|jgi:gas vesicle protein|nr:YtxH domain-containing protein [Anaerolineales bacterium]
MEFKTFLVGFLLGSAAGAAAALLYTPQSGVETRQQLMDNTQKLKETALDSFQEVQDMATARLGQAKKLKESALDSLEDVQDAAVDKLGQAQKSLESVKVKA